MIIFIFKYACKTHSLVFPVWKVATEDELNIQYEDRPRIFPSELWCEAEMKTAQVCTEDTSKLHRAGLLTAAWQVYVDLYSYTCWKGMEGTGHKNLSYTSAQTSQALDLYSQQWACSVEQLFTTTVTARM